MPAQKLVYSDKITVNPHSQRFTFPKNSNTSLSYVYNELQ